MTPQAQKLRRGALTARRGEARACMTGGGSVASFQLRMGSADMPDDTPLYAMEKSSRKMRQSRSVISPSSCAAPAAPGSARTPGLAARELVTQCSRRAGCGAPGSYLSSRASQLGGSHQANGPASGTPRTCTAPTLHEYVPPPGRAFSVQCFSTRRSKSSNASAARMRSRSRMRSSRVSSRPCRAARTAAHDRGRACLQRSRARATRPGGYLWCGHRHCA